MRFKDTIATAGLAGTCLAGVVDRHSEQLALQTDFALLVDARSSPAQYHAGYPKECD
jgi:hypothetical protein